MFGLLDLSLGCGKRSKFSHLCKTDGGGSDSTRLGARVEGVADDEVEVCEGKEEQYVHHQENWKVPHHHLPRPVTYKACRSLLNCTSCCSKLFCALMGRAYSKLRVINKATRLVLRCVTYAAKWSQD